MGRETGLSDAKIPAIIARQRPPDLSPDEAAAHDVAASLVSGGAMPAHLYDHAATTFGTAGVAELIQLVGLYALVSMTLNGFGEPVPAQACTHPAHRTRSA